MVGALGVESEERPLADRPRPPHRAPIILAAVDDDLVARMVAVSELHGEFVLSSGATSTVYFDKFRFLTRPDLLREVARGRRRAARAGDRSCSGRRRARRCCSSRPSSLATGLPVAVVRKQPKAYGTREQVEGAVRARRRDHVARGRQHDRAPGARGGRGAGGGRRRRPPDRARDRPRRRRTTCARRGTTWTRWPCYGRPARSGGDAAPDPQLPQHAAAALAEAHDPVLHRLRDRLRLRDEVGQRELPLEDGSMRSPNTSWAAARIADSFWIVPVGR